MSKYRITSCELDRTVEANNASSACNKLFSALSVTGERLGLGRYTFVQLDESDEDPECFNTQDILDEVNANYTEVEE